MLKWGDEKDMMAASEKNFVSKAVEMIKSTLAKNGVIILHTKELEPTVVEIGKLYHDMEKQEEL